MAASEASSTYALYEEKANREGIRIATFDGGGPSVYSQLLLMEEFMRRLEWDIQSQGGVDNNEKLDFDEDMLCPADHFDMMGGVGWGAYCALLLGRLRLPIGKAIVELVKLADTMFPKTPSEMFTPEANSERLKNAVEDMLQRNGFPIDMPLKETLGHGRQCKVVVFIPSTSIPGDCTPFRSYASRSSGSPKCTVVEAACAALSGSPEFSPVAIGPAGLATPYAGVPFGVSNPTRKVLDEARMVFGEEKPVSLILSLGAGKQPMPSTLTQFATDCERVNNELVQQLTGLSPYLRLDVDRGLEDLKTSDWHRLGVIGAHTRSYLRNESTSISIDKTLRSLHSKNHLTFAQLGMSGLLLLAILLAAQHFDTKATKVFNHHWLQSPPNRNINCDPGPQDTAESRLTNCIVCS